MLAGGPFRLALELRSAMKQEMPATGCLEGTHHVTGMVFDVGSQASLDHLGSAWFRTVATGGGYSFTAHQLSRPLVPDQAVLS